MSLSPSTRRATEFARLLDEPARTDDPDLAPYVALAATLRSVPAPSGPTPEFRAALRQRLVAVATVQPAGPLAQSPGVKWRTATSTWRMQRRIAVVAGGAAAATAIAGVGVGASRSLPGDPFYGVKRATERVQLAATTGREAKGKRHLEFARTRLHEVEALVGRDSSLRTVLPGGVAGALGLVTDEAKASTIISTLQDMDAETRAGAQDLLAVAQHDDASEPLQALNTFARDQFRGLRAVLPALPATAQPRATQSLSLLTVVAGRTAAVARTTSGGTGAAGSGGTSTPTRSTAPSRTATPTPSHHGTNAPQSGTSSSPSPSLPSVPVQVPTAVPTIPPLPTLLPVPSSLPTELPPLPKLDLP